MQTHITLIYYIVDCLPKPVDYIFVLSYHNPKHYYWETGLVIVCSRLHKTLTQHHDIRFLTGRITDIEMADDCLSDSMYVAVDYQQLVTPQSSAVRQPNKYEVLSNATKEKSNYQQLNVESNSVKHLIFLKQIKRQLRCTKVVTSIGLITTVCLAFVAIAAISLALRPVIPVNEQIKAVVNSTLGSKSPVSVFKNCFQEKRSCNIMHQLNGRVTCNTEILPSKKEVSFHTIIIVTIYTYSLYTSFAAYVIIQCTLVIHVASSYTLPCLKFFSTELLHS